MAKSSGGAVAVDLGASSGRFAAGWLEDGAISFEIVEQAPHVALHDDGRAVWDMNALLGICRRAIDFAQARFDRATLGIDAWGVDHGFIDAAGILIQSPVCYRDPSHVRAFESLARSRRRLYELTGIQHQPFNTICQLTARRLDSPHLLGQRWLVLPDLLGTLLGADPFYELTEASTTQLMGLDGRWCEEAFEIAGWPILDRQPTAPGGLGKEVARNVTLAHVGSHDTASAVCGFGELTADQAFLNLGTWSLLGTVIDRPLATPEAEDAGFTNERTVDGRVRFLKNIPGFYVVNRLHEDLAVRESVADWLAGTDEVVDERLDLLHPDLFNPDSMLRASSQQLGGRQFSPGRWAAIATQSMAATVASQVKELERVVGRKFSSLRVGGGGSKSEKLCRTIASASGLRVVAGPTEATVVGNLAMQFLASGAIADHAELRQVVTRSSHTVEYEVLEAR